MDKFGIFNLFSSLLGQSSKPSGENNADYSYSAPPPLNNNNNNNETSPAEKRAEFPPLQNSMLSTMRNHDEFVKRVLAQNKKP